MKRRPPFLGGGGPHVGGNGKAYPTAPRIEPVHSGFPRVNSLAVRLGGPEDTWVLRALRLRLRRPSLDMEIGDAGYIRFAPPVTGPVGWHHTLGGSAESGRVGALRYVQAGVSTGDVMGLCLSGQSMPPPRLAPRPQMGQVLETHQSAGGCRGPQTLRGSGRLAAHRGGLLFGDGSGHRCSLCIVLLLVGACGGDFIDQTIGGWEIPLLVLGPQAGREMGLQATWTVRGGMGALAPASSTRTRTSTRLRIGLGGGYGETPQGDGATRSSLARVERRGGLLPSHTGSAVAIPLLVGKVGKSQNCPLLRNSAGQLDVPRFRAIALAK